MRVMFVMKHYRACYRSLQFKTSSGEIYSQFTNNFYVDKEVYVVTNCMVKINIKVLDRDFVMNMACHFNHTENKLHAHRKTH